MDLTPTATSVNDLHPIAILVDELRSEDLTLRLNAIHRLSAIALALGEERTRTELLPFLHESLDDDDEILLALADELSLPFIEYVGGNEYAHLILSVLESLAAVEETLVREKATESINALASVLSASQIQDYCVPLVKRLSTGDWFTSRSSATALFAATYEQANVKTKQDLRSLFSTLCSDDTPMVRRAAAKEMGAFSKKLNHVDLVQDMLPTFKKLATDDQDSVRLLTVDALIAIAEALNDEECKQYLGQTMKAMVEDKSWRVRYMVADLFVKLATAAGQDIVQEDLVLAFVLLLKDNEAEVRTAAAGQIPGTFRLVSPLPLLSLGLTCMTIYDRIRSIGRFRDHLGSTHALYSRSCRRQLAARSSITRNSDLWSRPSSRQGADHRASPPSILAVVEG